MHRVAKVDILEVVPGPKPVIAAMWGVLCAAGFVGLRLAVDATVGGAAPFALTFPCIMIATLFGGPIAGLMCLALTVIYAWYYVLPAPESFIFVVALDFPRLVINAGAGAMIVALAQAFRQSVRATREAIAQRLQERELYQRELDHRIANNFATVAAILRIHQRRTKDPATADALNEALGRVDSIAKTHRHLYSTGPLTDRVDMKEYLEALCDSLKEALVAGGNISITCRFERIELPRDRAIAVGIISNELVTNAVKHAFRDGRNGAIDVTLERHGDDCRLIIKDNGVGLSDKSGAESGVRLVDNFATQAGGRLDVESVPGQGVRHTLILPI